jgi:hypothetical protein
MVMQDGARFNGKINLAESTLFKIASDLNGKEIEEEFKSPAACFRVSHSLKKSAPAAKNSLCSTPQELIVVSAGHRLEFTELMKHGGLFAVTMAENYIIIYRLPVVPWLARQTAALPHAVRARQ